MRNSTRLLLRSLLYSVSAGPIAIVCITPVMAQSTTGSIGGTVTDASGAPVAGATVTATNEGTNSQASAVTAADGGYVLDGLRPAPYTMRVDAGGTPIERRVILSIGQSATLDLAPEVEGAEIVSRPTSVRNKSGDCRKPIVTSFHSRNWLRASNTMTAKPIVVSVAVLLPVPGSTSSSTVSR